MGAQKPSILFCSPAGVTFYIDRQYLNELHAQGFEVDYTDSLAEVTLARLTNYNALVVYNTPEIPSITGGTPQDPTVFNNAIKQYLAMGGGVFLFPVESNGGQKQLLQNFTDLWGAKLPIEQIVESDPTKKADLDHAAGVSLAWTDQILPSPVSQGVTQLWYPTQRHYNGADSSPLIVDGTWTVVAKASLTATTQPIAISPPYPLVYTQRVDAVRSPALMALRDFAASGGAGRVALLAQWPQYTIGAGVKWIFDRQVLSRGAGNHPRSDWGVLLTNTFAWLAAPSLANHHVGGYTTTTDRLLAPNERPAALQPWTAQKNVAWTNLVASWQTPPRYVAPYRGLIGARTRYSTGANTVAEYKAAAKALGLQFVVFLEDFDQLTEAKLASLTKECAQNSDAEVALIPGYAIAANTMVDHLFMIGPKLVWPPADMLTGPNRTLYNLMETNAQGKYTGGLPADYAWVMEDGINAGYYNFTNPAGMRISDLRNCSMAAVRYYKNGALVEDQTANYLTCAQSASVVVPVSLNEVRSTAELSNEVARGHALTYVRAGSVPEIYAQGLSWSAGSIYGGRPVFFSDGPLIHEWPGAGNPYTLAAEEFVTTAALMPSRLEVSAANGLKEVALYDGRALYRRWAFHGETNYWATLLLGSFVQKDLVAVVTDQQDRRAVGYPRQCFKWSDNPLTWCSDHLNGQLLQHGMYWSPAPNRAPMLPVDVAGYTWDGGGALCQLPLAVFMGTGGATPHLETDAGVEDGGRFNQTPLVDFADEGVTAVASELDRVYAPNVPVWNANTFGPMEPSKLFTARIRFLLYNRPTIGPQETYFAGFPVNSGANVCLFRSETRFTTSCTVSNLHWAWGRMGQPAKVIPSSYFAWGHATPTVESCISCTGTVPDTTLHLVPGDWFAFFGGSAGHMANSSLFVVREQPITVRLLSTSPVSSPGIVDIHLSAVDTKVGDKALTVAQGQVRTQGLFSVNFPIDVAVTNVTTVTNVVAYLKNPTGLQVLRGKRADWATSPGLVECAPKNYTVEVKIPQPAVTNYLTVPLRVTGLNRRWTAGLWQKEGYVRGFYGSGSNRYREVGLDMDGCAYVPMYVNMAAQTWMVVGHPIVASGAGTNLVIQVTRLWDNPPRWSVTVNNPTTKPIKTKLSQAMTDLPGLDFRTTKVTLAAGEYRELRPAPRVLKLVMMGDSVTQSYLAPPGQTMPHFVEESLNADFRGQFTWVVVNQGCGGETAEQARKRVKQLLDAEKPDFITVSYGLNDTGKKDKQWFDSQLSQLIDAIQQHPSHPQLILLTATPFVNETHVWGKDPFFRDHGGLDAFLDRQLNAVTRQRAAARHLPLFDMHRAFVAQKDYEKMILPDGVHLTGEGYRYAGETVAAYLKALVKAHVQKDRRAVKDETSAVTQ